MRVRAEKADIHFIRTAGAEKTPPSTGQRLLTRVSGTLPHSPLGVTLSQPLATVAEIPRAWPAAIREKVRNDYPLLSCVQMGVEYLRAPLTDFQDAFQASRLEILRKEGVNLSAIAILSEEVNIIDAVSQVQPRIDGLEIQTPGELFPSEKCIDSIKVIQERFDLSVTLSPIVCREVTSGKQFPRFRLGVTPGEIAVLNEFLAENRVKVERVICKLNNSEALSDQIQKIVEISPLSQISNVDFSLEFSATDDYTNANLAAEALFVVGMLPGSRIYFEPLSDFDRTMDITHGLLDTLCNPRPTSSVLQSLNTILYSQPRKFSEHQLELKQVNGFKALQLSTDTSAYTLLLHDGPESTASEPINIEALIEPKEAERSRIYQLSKMSLKTIDFREVQNTTLTSSQTPVLVERSPIH